MTGALIGVGAGLAIGLGLLIWALRERGLREAERTARLAAEGARKQFEQIAKEAAKTAELAKADVIRRDEQNGVLRRRLAQVREKVADSAPIDVVTALIDAEGVEEVI